MEETAKGTLEISYNKRSSSVDYYDNTCTYPNFYHWMFTKKVRKYIEDRNVKQEWYRATTNSGTLVIYLMNGDYITVKK